MSYCKVIAIGRLGRDPEVRFTPSGTAIANFSIAVDDGWGNKKRTDWHRCVAFGKQAESLGQHAKKGALLLVEGSIKHREWTDKEGQKRLTTEILTDRWSFVGPKQDRDQGGGTYGSFGDAGGSSDDGGIPF